MKIREIINLNELKGKMYVMSDLHLGHENAIKYGNRPFSGVDQMNEFIIGELKTKLKAEDILIDLGDMFWDMNWVDCKRILDEIPVERFYKAVGNHDKDSMYFGEQARLNNCFTQLSDIIDVRLKWNEESYRLAFSHFPLLEWNHMSRGALMIHGHSHGSLDEFNDNSTDLRIDVGFDSRLAKEVGSFIIPIEAVIEKMYQKTKGEKFMQYYINCHQKGDNE